MLAIPSLPCSLLALTLAGSLAAQSIPSPESHFGFEIGTDKKLAHWNDIVEYLTTVGELSDRVAVDTLGSTTLGNPYLSVTISSAENLADLDRYRAIARQLADGKNLDDATAHRLAAEGKTIVAITHNMHANEIGSSQTSISLVYELANDSSPTTLEILDNVICVLIPSANPDGQIMITEWYRQTVDTDFEAASLPYLYHHYAGHDNNRDFFMGSLIETRHLMQVLYHDFAPQIYLDQHQMGSGGARIFVPPYPDPQNPELHPLLYQELRLTGGAIATGLQSAGKKGVLTGTRYRIYGQEGALAVRYHNIIGILTETASARIASPSEPGAGGRGNRGGGNRGNRGGGRGGGRGRGGRGRGSANEFSTTMVDPWTGGTWRLGDIVDYQLIAARSLLKQAARYSEEFLYNHYQMARDAITKSETVGPFAFLVTPDQRDPVTAADMVQRLILQGIHVERATAPFTAQVRVEAPLQDPAVVAAEATATRGRGGRGARGRGRGRGRRGGANAPAEAAMPSSPTYQEVSFPAGTFVVPAAQASRAALLDIMVRRTLPLRREYDDGPYMRMYDAAGYTVPMQMGVEVARVDTPVDIEVEEVETATALMPARVEQARVAYVLNHEINASYKAVNRLLSSGVAVTRLDRPVTFNGKTISPGAFAILANGSRQSVLQEISTEMRVPVASDPADLPTGASIESGRIGLYKPWTASMDEGWTRFILEEFEFPYRTLHNEDIRAGDLGQDLDIIIIPADVSLNRLIDGQSADRMPEEYAGGIGEEGIEELQRFVRNGGTLLAFEGADALLLEHFDIPVRNALQGLSQPEYYLPPSLVWIDVDQDHPLAYGLPERLAAKFAGGRAYEPSGWQATSGDLRVVASYPTEGRVLASGLLVGDHYLAGKAAVVEADYGLGRLVMYGFRVQHRAQTHGTYKLVFNALYADAEDR